VNQLETCDGTQGNDMKRIVWGIGTPRTGPNYILGASSLVSVMSELRKGDPNIIRPGHRHLALLGRFSR
jgi:hypothetical protein